jgi:hypothetical protein
MICWGCTPTGSPLNARGRQRARLECLFHTILTSDRWVCPGVPMMNDCVVSVNIDKIWARPLNGMSHSRSQKGDCETMQAASDRKPEAKQESGLPVHTWVRDGEGKCDFCSKEGLLEIVYFFHKEDAAEHWPPGHLVARIAIHAEAWKAGRLHRNPGNGDPCGLGLAVMIKSFYFLHTMDADSFTARFYSLWPAKTTRSGRRYHDAISVFTVK